MAKAPDAFRTISEVADTLDTPAHVLRFWESKFSQIKPVKGAGGRRYYRPKDISLLSGIKQLLHEQGMTIKGAQKLLREKGIKYVSSLTAGDDADTKANSEKVAKTAPTLAAVPEPEPVEALQTVRAKVRELDVSALVAPETPSARSARWFPTDGKTDNESIALKSKEIIALVERLSQVTSSMRST